MSSQHSPAHSFEICPYYFWLFQSLLCRRFQDKAQGSRKYSHMVINSIADAVPELMGGSADLTGSNNTDFK